MNKNKKQIKPLILFGVFMLLFAIGFSLLCGNNVVTTHELLKMLTSLNVNDTAASLILFQVRLPRITGGLLCGVALSVSGLLLQISLDNALASPGIMGVNSGAGLFVLLAGIIFPFSAFSRQIFGFVGAIIAILVVYTVCKIAGFSKATLILTGVAVSSLFSAGSNTIITLFPGAVADRAAFSLGGLSGVTWSQLAAAAPWITLGVIVTFVYSESMGLLLLGDETAAGLGIKPSKLRKLALFTSAILAGAAVSICGLLSFVGLIIPNLIRRLEIQSITNEFLLCSLYGSSFLIICDIIARNLFFPYELPVGLILSFLGAPFFLYMIIRRKRNVIS